MSDARYRIPWFVMVLCAICAAGFSTPAQSATTEAQAAMAACPETDSGLKLPAGFCATIFADGIGHARHLVVAANGVVYVNTWALSHRTPAASRTSGSAN
jgi:glucose/arabinose dehydrogenase